MELKDLSPNLMVKDVNKTVDYYSEILGFSTVAVVPESGDFVFAIMRRDNIMLMFQQEQSLKDEYPQLDKFVQGGGITFYIHVTDIRKLYAELKDRAIIAKDLHQTFYGSVDFAVEDCNGYLFTFSQENTIL